MMHHQHPLIFSAFIVGDIDLGRIHIPQINFLAPLFWNARRQNYIHPRFFHTLFESAYPLDVGAVGGGPTTIRFANCIGF